MYWCVGIISENMFQLESLLEKSDVNLSIISKGQKKAILRNCQMQEKRKQTSRRTFQKLTDISSEKANTPNCSFLFVWSVDEKEK